VVVLALFSGASGLLGCAAEPGPPKNLPAASTSTGVGPGDLFEITVVGEKDLPKEYQVQSDGTIDFPYIHRVKVDGLEPPEVVDLLKKQLVENQILQDPQITLVVKQSNTNNVIVSGSVQKPDVFAWNPGITLMGAISRCGWFNQLADTKHVRLIRRAGKGKSIQVVINVEAITEHKQEDVALAPGDAINVDQRTF
jgi:protein involved in polysaccharide export with SLBB domain